MQISVKMLLKFLADLFKAGLGYSAIGTAKSAIITFVSLCSGDSFDQHTTVMNKFMRGIFAKRPALPKYNSTWDTAIVLSFLEKQFPHRTLSLLQLTKKLAVLLLLLSGQRGQSIHSLDIRNIECSDVSIVLRFGEVLKTSKPGRHLQEIVLPAFNKNPALCVVLAYRDYVKRTLPLRVETDRLFLSTIRPYHRAARDTVSNWVKAVLAEAGINLKIYGPHSTRGASTSLAALKGVPLNTIVKTAGWSSAQTFRFFYQKPITRNTQFANCVLDSSAT